MTKEAIADLTGFEHIEVYGAREHNLKDINVKIPRNKLVVITGISGSGKSSLAFDTIYAEGQRRYMESFSAYARSFIGDMERPDVDKIEGLSPVISIEQKPFHGIPGPRWALSLRSMISCACYLLVPVKPTLMSRGKR
jgi:excinuclease ABC subunit A